MTCPKCRAVKKTETILTVQRSYGTYRRRKCLACGHRFSTREKSVKQVRK